MPWSPPGLKWLSVKSGAKNFAIVTEAQIMTIIMPMNHFHRFILYAFISRREARNMNAGMRNAASPKHCLTKK